MNNRGNLLVSTRSGAAGRKLTICICGAILAIAGIIILLTPEAFRALSRRNYHLISLVCGVAAIAVAAYFILVAFLGGRSYCEVYENAVTGMTALSRNQPNVPMQNFEVKYADIHNVTDAGKRICIYTPYAVYEVLAMKNCQEVVREIRARMAGAAK